ncbi:glycosyltransferase family 2 protein [Uliginosibacterium sp. TH139]|uniref:glycosyltransferase family 2 protein n=1 Tax=Uliginosibacterium sp. TH139 TaxID=2067453 RepID=UPI00130431C1|nr:glycosyltransferase family 2 protein [Uliginosibacterium sp. TH139]
MSSVSQLRFSPDETTHVAAVIVSYHPDIQEFRRVLESLRAQVAAMIVVDNGSGDGFLSALEGLQWPELTVLPLRRNAGIAAAQNEGIRCALEQGATHVLLLDHDSRPLTGMVPVLIKALGRLSAKGHRVAAVGPTYVDARQGNQPVFVRVKGLSLSRVTVPDFEDLARVDHLIASGSLISAPVLRDIGLMDDSLFIDYVDVEWCLRASSRGYEVFGCFSAQMEHSLGDEPIRLLGRSFPARTPLRHYYTFRNAVALTRRSYVGSAWKQANLVALVIKFVFYLSFSTSRSRHLNMMLRGVWHGLRGLSGPLRETT